MPRLLSELVHFIGEDAALVAQAKKAIRWLASKPEGRAVLEDAMALHGAREFFGAIAVLEIDESDAWCFQDRAPSVERAVIFRTFRAQHHRSPADADLPRQPAGAARIPIVEIQGPGLLR